ncbi:colanic acid biosynthesis glycosyltransferase WcaL [bacterium]|nr:MAG: colanic acid biosynthesis glycosyltransferase WcaL [bacterium]
MKVAYLTSQFPFGFAEAFLEAEAAVLAELCGDLLVVPARPKSRESRFPGLHARCLRLSAYAPGTMFLALREFVRSPVRALSLLIRITGARYRRSAKLKNLILFPKALAVAGVLRAQRVEHIHAHWLSTPSTIAYLAAELTGIPWSCTAHRFDIFEDNLLPEKMKSARFVRVISARSRALVVMRRDGAPSERCTVLHMGVALGAAAPQPGPGQGLRLLCAASLRPVKGHRYLVDALAHLRDRGIPVHCDLVGEGPLRTELARQIRALALPDRVCLRGSVPHDVLLAELASGAYDLAVLASTEAGTEFEGIPVALMEAMAAGVPCVATATGSIPELIAPDSGSVLVPQRDATALAAAIASFRDPAFRDLAARQARGRIASAFDVHDTAGRLYHMMAVT